MQAKSSLILYKELQTHLEKNKFSSPGVYWLEGEEDFFLDEVVSFFEQHCIPDDFKTFNQHIVFGQDIEGVDIITLAKQAPMGYDKQLVIVKEAQLVKQLEKIIYYLDNLSPFTILVIAYKTKKIDKRSALYKKIDKSFTYLHFPKLYANQLEPWIAWRAEYHNISFSQKAVHMLQQHIGNNLPLLESEFKKLAVNFTDKKIEEQNIVEYIGVNKKYNVFELQSAIARQDMKKAYEIALHFEKDIKNNPPQIIVLMLYNYFSKLYMLYGVQHLGKSEIATSIGVHPFFVDEYIQCKKNYTFDEMCLCIQTISHYYKKLIGINASTAEQENGLLRELIFRLIHAKEVASIGQSTY